MHQGFRKELWTKLVEVLIIDEISMLSGEWLDNLERMLRELTHYYGRGEFQQYLRMPMKDIPAFGGIQVVVVGDFYQLPPIPVRLSARINWSARRRDSLVDLRAGDYPRRDLPAIRSWALPRATHPQGFSYQKDLLHEPRLRLPVDGVARGGICVRAPAHVPPHRRVGACVPVWKYCVGLREPPRHPTTSRRWRGAPEI